jgi:hypothetical protein
MNNIVTRNKEQLAKVLREIADAVEKGDSFDGLIEYHIQDRGGEFDVVAGWRVGNLEGQGGMRFLQ